MSIFATPQEIEDLTGRRTVAAQIEWLKERGILVVRNPSGELMIPRTDIECHRSTKNQGKLDPFSDLLHAPASIEKVRIDRRASGIYMLKKGEDVVYVGKTTNFLSRSTSHVWNVKYDFDFIEFVPLPKSQLNLYEQELIARLCPKYNVMHNTFAEPATPSSST